MKSKLSHIKTRRGLNDFFDSIFKKTYKSLKVSQRLEYEETLPKTYMIEFNTGEKYDEDGGDEKKRESLQRTLLQIKEEIGINITATEDPSLTHITTKKFGELFIDSFDPRFLFFHTLAKSEHSDAFIFRKLIKSGYHFDAAWFTVQFLEKLAERINIVEGWDARFSPIVDVSEMQKPDYLGRRVSVSIDEPNSWKRYKQNKNTKFFEELPLSTLRVRSITDEKLIARARIQSDGKLTGRGTSFQEYLNIVSSIKDDYSRTVIGLEEKYSIKFIKDDVGFKIKGEPFVIKFSKKIKGFDDFINSMFSCTLPFRLLGTPQQIKKDYIKVNAIDLHVASKIYFEITPNFMRIYLPDNTCGNSIVRIIRSLQHRVDPNLQLDE